jgi:hypothetical protein
VGTVTIAFVNKQIQIQIQIQPDFEQAPMGWGRDYDASTFALVEAKG